MKKVLFVATLLLVGLLVACGAPAQQPGGGAAGGEESAPANTPTPVVLATPTPRPAPPTPTPKPSSTPTEEPAELESAEEAEAEAETEAEGEEEAQVEEEGETEAATEEEQPTEEPAPAGPAIAEDMVEVPAGTFIMGQDGSKPKNGPAHEVDLPAYMIDRFEVTNDEFAAFVEDTGYVTYAEENSTKNWHDAAEKGGNHPVVYITWDDAQAFCEWRGAHLPTEAQWEKAARGTDGRVYPWGDEFPGPDEVIEYGNFYETGLRATFPVGGFEKGASPYGLYDMAGNVREWTADHFLPYEGTPMDANPFFGEENRVNRGGGWFDGQDGELVTTYNRNAGPPGTSANDDIGFRCAREIE